MIKNIIFDLGNVLFEYNPMKFIEKYVKIENRESFFNVVFNSKEWKDLDRGVLEYEEAVEIFSKKLPEEREKIEKLFGDDIADVIFPIEKNIEFVKEIKKRGYKLYILSNFHKKAFRRIERLYNLDSIFDGKIVSFEVNLLKPEKEIYEVLLGKYSLNPDETIFIDDTFENIVVAKKIGIKGIELKDFNELENILKGACSL